MNGKLLLSVVNSRRSFPSSSQTILLWGATVTMATRAADSYSLNCLHRKLLELTRSMNDSLTKTPYKQEGGSSFSVKSYLVSLLVFETNDEENPETIMKGVRDLYLCCSALCSVDGKEEQMLSWVPKALASEAFESIKELSKTLFCDLDHGIRKKVFNVAVEFSLVPDEEKLVLAVAPAVLLFIKDIIRDSTIDQLEDASSASCARAPVGSAVVAAHQLRWNIERMSHPHLGKLCAWVIPCVLTALDHWSPKVKGQAMIGFIHVGKNMNASEFGSYADVILDACSRNIAVSDEIWCHAIEMSVIFVVLLQGGNPRSNWYEKLLNEMLGHLERHPNSKELRVPWLQLIRPVFSAMGLVIVANFRRIFPLMLKWIHADDDQTVLLVLENLQAILKFTWMRNTSYVERLIDELALTYKEASLRRKRETIRQHIVQIFVLLQKCKGMQFETAWSRHKDDSNLTTLSSSLGEQLLFL